jgi:hypothetical protein
MLETYLKWIEAHERLLLVAIGGAVLWFALGRIDTLIANHDKANLTQAQTTALIQAQKDQALATAAQQAAAQYQALAERVQAQNAALEQANVTLATALAKQQKTDASLPPTELVARMNTLVPAAGATVTPTGVALPSTGAVAITQQLERVPVLTSELDNEIAEVGQDQKLIDAGVVETKALTDQVTGLKLQIVDDNKVCTDKIAVVKAEARKSKRRWFVAGVVVGFSVRQAIKTYLGF